MATRIRFSANDMTVLLDGQALTIEAVDTGGFITNYPMYAEIDKNGKLEIISGDGSGIIIRTAAESSTMINVSAGGSVDININDYPNGIYVDIDSAPPMEEYTYTLNITGLAITQLAPFLTNIANAIRTKKGTSETINAQDFASEIESIETGSSSNWTEEQGYGGSINFTIWYTNVYVMDFANYEGDAFLHHTKITATRTETYSSDVNMILIWVDTPQYITITNLNNVEVLKTNNHSYVILKPTGENFSCDIEVEGP